MINDIITGISKKLYSTFGENYSVYVENVEQYLQKPCFCITHISTNQQRISKQRYISRNLFDILFFASEDEQKKQMYDIADTMLEELEYIDAPINGLLHGTEMRHEIIDDVLHFFVNYNLVLLKTESTDNKMEQKEINVGVKE